MRYRFALLALTLLCLSGCMEGSKSEPLPRAADASAIHDLKKEIRS